jgi:hypothetical protein
VPLRQRRRVIYAMRGGRIGALSAMHHDHGWNALPALDRWVENIADQSSVPVGARKIYTLRGGVARRLRPCQVGPDRGEQHRQRRQIRCRHDFAPARSARAQDSGRQWMTFGCRFGLTIFIALGGPLTRFLPPANLRGSDQAAEELAKSRLLQERHGFALEGKHPLLVDRPRQQRAVDPDLGKVG